MEPTPDNPTDDAPPPPPFLFFHMPPEELERRRTADALTSPDGVTLRLYEDEDAIPARAELDPAGVGIVEGGRASRNEIVFAPVREGVFEVEAVPLRFVLSVRRGFERQVSAGGVLARGRGEEVEFALMRTLPRHEAVARASGRHPRPDAEGARARDADDDVPDDVPAEEPPEFSDPREPNDRRAADRRRAEGRPPDGQERRRGRSRRMRRRRRSSRWGPQGRLELPKGKLEPGETARQAAVREVREELGLTAPVEVREQLSKNHYTFRTPDGRTIFKTVHYFLLLSGEQEPSFAPRAEEGVISVEWWSGQRAIQQVAFPNLRPVLERAWDLLQD